MVNVILKHLIWNNMGISINDIYKIYNNNKLININV